MVLGLAQRLGDVVTGMLPMLPVELVTFGVCVFTAWIWYENLRVYLRNRRLSRLREQGAYAEKEE
jgi:hypothetical protein